MSFLYLINFLIPQESFLTPVIEELTLKRWYISRFCNDLPYEWDEEIQKFSKRKTAKRVEKILVERVKFFKNMFEKYNGYIEVGCCIDTSFNVIAKGGRVFKRRNVIIFVEPGIRKGKLTPYYPYTRISGDFTIDLIRGYLLLDWWKIKVLVGRESLSIGPSHWDNFLLSGCGPPFDMVKLRCDWKNVRVKVLSAMLDWWKVEEKIYYRIYSLHRVAVSLLRNYIQIGVSEFGLFAEEKFPILTLGITYFTPFILYHIYSVARGKKAMHNDNIGGAIDFTIYGKGFAYFGEVFVDYIEFKKTYRNIPNIISFQLGVKMSDFLLIPRSMVVVKFIQSHSWAYIHRNNYGYCDYIFVNQCLGHPLGPDFFGIKLKLTHHYNKSMDLYFNLSFLTKGEVHLGDRWPIIFKDEPQLPSGVAENEFKIGGGVEFFYRNTLKVKINGEHKWIDNWGNTLGRKGNLFGIFIGIMFGIPK